MNQLESIQYLHDIHADIRRAISNRDADLFEKHAARLARQRDERGAFAKLFELFALTPLRELPSAAIRLARGDISAWGASLDAPFGHDRETTLLFAVRQGAWDIAGRLLDMGCEPALADINGISAVHHLRHLYTRHELFRNPYFSALLNPDAFDALCERLSITPQAQARQEKRILAEAIGYELEPEASTPSPRASKRL